MGFLTLAALLPAAVLLFYVYSKDRVEKEPPRLILKLFLFGALAGPIAAILENILFVAFETVLPPGSLVLLVLEYFIGVAAVEEGCKYFFLNTIRRNPEFNYVFDGIVYAVAVALGFAALENVLYVFDGGLEVAITRAIFAVPGHAADGVIMGTFYGLAKCQEVFGDVSGARGYRILALAIPILEHGFYDCALSMESEVMGFVALAVELAFIIFAMVLVNRVSKRDQAIYTNGNTLQ